MGHGVDHAAGDVAAILLGVSETAIETRPPRAGTGLRAAAVLLNAVLFAVGVYFEVHPRDRQDVWSAAAVAGVAIINSAALTVQPGPWAGPRFVPRLRRIATIANSLLLAVAVVIVAFKTWLDWHHAALHGVALLAPPLLTIVALRRLPPIR
jgi:hypothetical protein